MRYIIFAKDSCPFCIKTLELLEQQELPHSVINFEPDQEVILGEIKEAYDWKTVPMIITRSGTDIKFIGGYTDLEKLLQSV